KLCMKGKQSKENKIVTKDPQVYCECMCSHVHKQMHIGVAGVREDMSHNMNHIIAFRVSATLTDIDLKMTKKPNVKEQIPIFDNLTGFLVIFRQQ
ncbi:hypothetical protein STEG23_023685, partial [Scotinomys teguina]